MLSLRRFRKLVLPILVLTLSMYLSSNGYCSVESSLGAIQSKLISTILPMAAILGLVIAALSFVAGSQNARSHLILAIFGALIGFGAPSIVEFLRGLVN